MVIKKENRFKRLAEVPKKRNDVPLTDQEKGIYQFLTNKPIHIDELIHL